MGGVRFFAQKNLSKLKKFLEELGVLKPEPPFTSGYAPVVHMSEIYWNILIRINQGRTQS